MVSKPALKPYALPPPPAAPWDPTTVLSLRKASGVRGEPPLGATPAAPRFEKPKQIPKQCLTVCWRSWGGSPAPARPRTPSRASSGGQGLQEKWGASRLHPAHTHNLHIQRKGSPHCWEAPKLTPPSSFHLDPSQALLKPKSVPGGPGPHLPAPPPAPGDRADGRGTAVRRPLPHPSVTCISGFAVHFLPIFFEVTLPCCIVQTITG